MRMKFTVKHCKNASKRVGIIFTSTLCCNFACNFFQCSTFIIVNYISFCGGKLRRFHWRDLRFDDHHRAIIEIWREFWRENVMLRKFWFRSCSHYTLWWFNFFCIDVRQIVYFVRESSGMAASAFTSMLRQWSLKLYYKESLS